MPEIGVRPCGVADATTLRAIRLEALRDTPDAYGSTFADLSRWSPHRWREAARDWNFYFGLLDGEEVGLASGGWNDEAPGTHWLYAMYVAPRARGTGVADALVEEVARWARAVGGRHLYLHVTETVTRARTFYGRLGFVPTGEMSTMTRDPSLRLLTMVRDLD